MKLFEKLSAELDLLRTVKLSAAGILESVQLIGRTAIGLAKGNSSVNLTLPIYPSGVFGRTSLAQTVQLNVK